MMEIKHIVGDIVCILLRDPNNLKEINLEGPSIHVKVRGYDKIGIWIAHPGLVLVKTEDGDGNPIHPKNQVQENIDASILITWDNILSVMHYPNREGYDQPSPWKREFGFKTKSSRKVE